MNLNAYMERGISQLVETARRYYLNNPKGIAFLARIAPEIKKSAKRRKTHEEAGVHVPPLIIASIASQCNLHCPGCYSRATGACSGDARKDLTTAEWGKIFTEASGLGVTFILLAGGEPLTRRDIVDTAASFKNMIFPIFTNGTMMDEEYIKLFEQKRNLIPIFSIEGDREMTNNRRGDSIYEIVQDTMRRFRKKKMLFGASITVTKENMDAVTNRCFVEGLRKEGCGLLFFVEYVPVETGTEHLMLNAGDIKRMQGNTMQLRQGINDMILVSFPGDEEAMGGCLASGRGFFHINASGGAEPCPFSPHSDLNLRTDSMEAVLRSDFFKSLREIASSAGHNGGCTLFNHEQDVVELLRGNA